MNKILTIALMSVLLPLGMAWSGSPQANGLQAGVQTNIPKGYEGLVRAGYPIDTIFAIDQMHRERRALGLRIQALATAKRQLLEIGYRDSFLAWWPWMPPKGHPNGSLWVLSRYVRDAWGMRQKHMDELSKTLAHSEYSLRDLDESLARVGDVLNAEASIQGQIFLEERALKEKYSKLAREIGAKAPWDMLTEKAIRDAMESRRQ